MKLLRLACCLLVLCFVFPTVVYAEGTTDVENRIVELQRKVTELQGQEKSLSQQISLFNSQIALTTLRIDSMKAGISKLASEIGELTTEIDRLEILKTKRLELVLHRIPQTYKRAVIPQFGMLLFSTNFSDFLTRFKYLSVVQEQDAQFYRQLQNTQDHFNERKAMREKKKEEHEALTRELEIQSAELEKKKKEKQVLLDQTKNSESVYQKLLSQALAEKQALERALVDSVKVGPVKKGDPVALVGNTGYPACSTGAHLHFEVRKNNAWVDPATYLSSKTVQDEQNGGTWTVGSGSWDWPLADTIRVTQHYGHTPWSWRYSYSGGIHTGFDMTSTAGDVIRAPADGTLYSSSQSCGTSSIIKIKYIDYGDNLVSFFLHVQ